MLKPKPTMPEIPAMTGIEPGEPVFIRIFKAEKVLELWLEDNDTYRLHKTYPICAFSGRLGPKTKEGDKQAPEGFYKVYKNSLNPGSRFLLSFNLGFPNAFDLANGYTGSWLMVHGGCVSVGCYAMTDPYITEIYSYVELALSNGQNAVDVHIFPFRMTEAAMKEYAGHKWIGFWEMLKQGYDFFETNAAVPDIKVDNKRYLIE